MSSHVGKRIVALRQARGMSQPALARAVGISQPSMYNIESGKTKKLRGDTLAGLCRVLSISPDALLSPKSKAGEETLLLETELVAIWRSITPADQDHLLAIARALAGRMLPRRIPGPPPSPAAPPSTTDFGSLLNS